MPESEFHFGHGLHKILLEHAPYHRGGGQDGAQAPDVGYCGLVHLECRFGIECGPEHAALLQTGQVRLGSLRMARSVQSFLLHGRLLDRSKVSHYQGRFED